MRHPFALLLLLAGVCGCGANAGSVITVPAAAPIAAAPAASPSLLVVPTQSPAVQLSSSEALRTLLSQLNANTAETARGEYVVLSQLSDALRNQIDQLLSRPPRR